jgi:hypothetical protein
LAPEAFRELNDIVWRGFGAFLNLPNHESVHKEFGILTMGRGTNKDVPKSMCLL